MSGALKLNAGFTMLVWVAVLAYIVGLRTAGLVIPVALLFIGVGVWGVAGAKMVAVSAQSSIRHLSSFRLDARNRVCHLVLIAVACVGAAVGLANKNSFVMLGLLGSVGFMVLDATASPELRTGAEVASRQD